MLIVVTNLTAEQVHQKHGPWETWSQIAAWNLRTTRTGTTHCSWTRQSSQAKYREDDWVRVDVICPWPVLSLSTGKRVLGSGLLLKVFLRIAAHFVYCNEQFRLTGDVCWVGLGVRRLLGTESAAHWWVDTFNKDVIDGTLLKYMRFFARHSNIIFTMLLQVMLKGCKNLTVRGPYSGIA